jgi:hypothetical protein
MLYDDAGERFAAGVVEMQDSRRRERKKAIETMKYNE